MTGIDQDFLDRLERISIYARRTLSGSMEGKRRSKARGSSAEFSDYREYSNGDDFRRIDWNAYARFERLFLKLFMEERETKITILLDTSKSMTFGEPAKSQLSMELAAAFAYMSLSSYDRVGLYALGGEGEVLPHFSGKQGFGKVLDFLDRLSWGGESSLNEALLKGRMGDAGTMAGSGGMGTMTVMGSTNNMTGIGSRGNAISMTGTGTVSDISNISPMGGNGGMFSHEGIAVIITDLFFKDGFSEGLKSLRHRRQETVLLHILSPQELEPPYSGPVRLVDSENGLPVELTATLAAVKAYKARLESFISEARDFCVKHGIDYMQVSSGQSLEEVIFDKLLPMGIIR